MFSTPSLPVIRAFTTVFDGPWPVMTELFECLRAAAADSIPNDHASGAIRVRPWLHVAGRALWMPPSQSCDLPL